MTITAQERECPPLVLPQWPDFSRKPPAPWSSEWPQRLRAEHKASALVCLTCRQKMKPWPGLCSSLCMKLNFRATALTSMDGGEGHQGKSLRRAALSPRRHVYASLTCSVATAALRPVASIFCTCWALKNCVPFATLIFIVAFIFPEDCRTFPFILLYIY